ncbi:hypothetical protein HBI81_023550 [Parastagonospora nodorum]|nr:hypothetical protein HBI81_023550 [Parastagonospora nodorum]
MQRVETVLILIFFLLNNAEVLLPANADTRVAKMLRSMRLIFINNDLLRHKQDSICNAMTLISDKYEILYAEVKREIRERAILYYLLQSTAPNSRLRIITHLVMCSKRRKMQYNYNPKTRLQNNDRYAEAIVYSARQSNTFIQTLEREVEFEDKRSSIYYYTKIADS